MKLQYRLRISFIVMICALGTITAAVLAQSRNANLFNDEFASSRVVVHEVLQLKHALITELEESRFYLGIPHAKRTDSQRAKLEGIRSDARESVQSALAVAATDNKLHEKISADPSFVSSSVNALNEVQRFHVLLSQHYDGALARSNSEQKALQEIRAAEGLLVNELEPRLSAVIRVEMAELAVDQMGIQKSLHTMTSAASSTLALAFLILLGLLGPVVTTTARKLRALEASIRSVSVGNFGLKLEEGGEDELSEIFRAFNRMAEGLKLAHQQIDSNNARFRSLLESLSTVVFQTDTEGRCIFLNPAWREITGHPIESLFGESLLQFVCEKHRPSVSQLIAAIARKEQTLGILTILILTSTGAARWMELVVRPVASSNGEVFGLTGTLSDVDDSVRALEMIQENERSLAIQHKLLTTVLNHLPVGLYCKDVRNELRYTLYNNQAERILGTRQLDVLGKNDLELLPREEALAERKSELELLSRHSSEESIERPVLRDARKSSFVRVLRIPIYGEKGDPQLLLSIVEDITEKKQRQRESDTINEISRICLNAETLTEIYEKVPTALTTGLGFDYSIIALAVPERSELEVAGAVGMEAVLKQGRRLPLNSMTTGDAIATGEFVCIDNPKHPKLSRVVSRHLKTRCVLAAPMRIDQNILGAVTVGSPFERKIPDSLKNTLKLIANILGQTIDRKKSEAVLASNARLASLGEMSSGIAHEINNPLAVIIGKSSQLVTLANEGRLSADSMVKGLTRIEAMGWRISKIIRGLKDFSRDADSDPFSVAGIKGIIEETLELCGERFRNSEIELRVLPIPDCDIECRPIQVSQVLLNLLNNAYDAIQERAHAPSNGPKWVELGLVDLGEEVLLSVTDSGLGIPPAIASKIMQPFFTTKGPGKGTGLGLSISRGIIDRHHGRFSLDREHPNTRFTIYLPKRQPAISHSAA